MSEKWIRDTGLVFAPVFLILGFKGSKWALVVSSIFLLIVLFAPSLLTSLANLWHAIAETLGSIMNKVFFGFVYIVVVVPVAIFKRVLGRDMRFLSKDGSYATAFVEAESVILKETFEKPY